MPLDLSAVKRRLQDHLQEGLLIVVGSGLSAAEGIPGMGLLAEHLKREIPPRLTNAPVNSVRSVMDSSYGRRVWSGSSSTWPRRDSASGCFVPQERDGAKRVLSQSWNGFEHAGPGYESELEARILDVHARLKAGNFKAPPVRRVEIPKGPGKAGTRPLGIPTVVS